ncbi:Cell wall-binding protein YocH precursor [compost metagenome]
MEAKKLDHKYYRAADIVINGFKSENNKVVDMTPKKLNTYEVAKTNKSIDTAIKTKEKWLTFTLTAYNNNEKSTGKKPGDRDYGVTASGRKTQQGRTIAADWRVLPKGTRVYIEGVGERVVEDKGGAIKNRRIDVYFKTEKECIEFGKKKNVKVKIIKIGD